jgi:putative Ig domain-containing protein/FG-GAP repeat protein
MLSPSVITRPVVRVPWLALLLVLVSTWLGASQPLVQLPDAAAGATQSVVSGQTPDGLDAAAWADIKAQIAAHAYQAVAEPDAGYRSANVAHGWQIGYRADGTTRLSPRDQAASPWTWGLRLRSYGYAQPVVLTQPAQLMADGAQLTYQWDASLSEWWQNSAEGLEQGWTIQRRPPGQAATQPLELRLALSGDLRAQPQSDSLAFVDAGGANAFTYGKLRAWDATGRVLDSHMTLRDGQIVLGVQDATARYPLTIDPLLQQAYLKASNADQGDGFGVVAVSGDTVVVGAPGKDGRFGAAYVFVRSGSSWSQQAELTGFRGSPGLFGRSVAVSGDTIVVGAPREDYPGVAQATGAAYVFVRSGSTWSEPAQLTASNRDADDVFGASVAVSGDTVVVGAPGEASKATGVNDWLQQDDNSMSSAGAAYVFVRSGGWSQQAYLKASNTNAGDLFGWSVAASGDTVVVGAPYEASSATGVNGNQADNSLAGAGASYVFVRSGDTWSQQAYLKASNTGTGPSQFGASMAVSGDTIVVGAPGKDLISPSDPTQKAGAAYVFVRSGGSWSQQAELKASNTDRLDAFGWSVALSGGTIVVGAPGEASKALGVNGNQADNSALEAGAAYKFVRSGSSWSQQAYLKASNTDAGDRFGRFVAVAGDTVVVGALDEDSSATGVHGNQYDNSAEGAGAAYVFAVGPGEAPAITSAAPPAGTLGTPYSFMVTASGTAPFSFSASGLPPRLTLNPTTGLISGTPIDTGWFPVTITVSNGFAPNATQTVTLVVTRDGEHIVYLPLVTR